MLGDWSLFQGLYMFENSSLETRGSIDPGAVPFPNKNNINLAMSLALLKTQESPQNRVHFLQKSTTFILFILIDKNADFKNPQKYCFLFRLKKNISTYFITTRHVLFCFSHAVTCTFMAVFPIFISQWRKPYIFSPFLARKEDKGFWYELRVQVLTLKTHMRRDTELRCP